MKKVTIKTDLDHSKLSKLGYIYNIMEGGYVSPDGATIVSINRSPYQREVMQFRRNAEAEHLVNIEQLKQIDAIE